MKKLLFYLIISALIGLLAACSTSPERPKIHPAEDKLTFAFFFTDG